MATGRRTWRSGENILDTSKAEYAAPRRVKRRTVREAGRHYVAYDAHSLINADSQNDTARPGHMFE